MTEPEEIIEAHLITILAAAVPSMDVVGALSAVPSGEQKLSADSYISVFVDVASQQIDWRGPGVPFTYSARVTIHFANADDASGAGFRDSCRSVRSALAPLLGDGCSALDGGGFSCDEFILDSTQTAMDADAETGGMAKTYSFTISGRLSEVNTTHQGD